MSGLIKETRYKAVDFKSTRASLLLDLIRGIAAVLVLLEHWRNMIYVDYPNLPGNKAVFVLPYLISSAGHQAVIIFFVLSGYLISGSIYRATATNRWSWKSYLTHRFVRLWVVLIPGLILCALWDDLGLRSGSAPKLYAGLVNNHLNVNVHATQTLSNFVGNIFFLQTIVVSVFGSDQALWSLANEFWYYLLFPLAFLTFHNATSRTTRIWYGLLFVSIAWFVRGEILLLFPLWLLGAWLSSIKPPNLGPRSRYLAGLIYIVLLFIFPKVHFSVSLWGDYLFGAVTTGFLWIVLSADERVKPESHLARFSKGLADMSYTLYIVHMPFSLFLVALWIGDERWVPTIHNIFQALCILLLTAIYAWLVASLTEKNTEKIRKQVEKFIN